MYLIIIRTGTVLLFKDNIKMEGKIYSFVNSGYIDGVLSWIKISSHEAKKVKQARHWPWHSP